LGRLTRAELDEVVGYHRIPEPGVAVVFAVAEASPSPAEDRRFLRSLLSIGGVLSLSAGAVFFVAANWAALGALGRFALVHGALLAAAAFALWRPPPVRIGRLALLAAFILTGALLALFGQTYQTGADVHELFFAWAALGLPLVVLGHWAVSWGAWVVVLNVALALLCGWLPGGHVLWSLLLGFYLSAPLLFAVPLVANLALWLACEAAARTRLRDVAAPWLGRLVLAAAFGFATWGAVGEIAGVRREGPEGGGALLLLALALAAIGVGAYTARRRRDVFPLAVVSASAIAVGAALVGRIADRTGSSTSVAFVLMAWLVASSTGAGWLLMERLRRWREGGTLA
jgi:uncharacterized membrane protein